MFTTKTIWRVFLSYSDPKQEQWLETQARLGWHLVGVAPLRFKFVQKEPREDRYRMDFQLLRGKQRQDYLQLFQDAGWDLVGQLGNRYYFRASGDTLSPEIHSDSESRKGRLRRELVFMSFPLLILGIGLSHVLGRFIDSGHIDWSWAMPVLLVAFWMLVAIRSVWKLARALRSAR